MRGINKAPMPNRFARFPWRVNCSASPVDLTESSHVRVLDSFLFVGLYRNCWMDLFGLWWDWLWEKCPFWRWEREQEYHRWVTCPEMGRLRHPGVYEDTRGQLTKFPFDPMSGNFYSFHLALLMSRNETSFKPTCLPGGQERRDGIEKLRCVPRPREVVFWAAVPGKPASCSHVAKTSKRPPSKSLIAPSKACVIFWQLARKLCGQVLWAPGYRTIYNFGDSITK